MDYLHATDQETAQAIVRTRQLPADTPLAAAEGVDPADVAATTATALRKAGQDDAVVCVLRFQADHTTPGQPIALSGIRIAGCWVAGQLGSVDAAPAADLPPGTIEVYSMQGCPFCAEAKRFLQGRGIPFVEHDAGDDAIAARMMALTGDPEGGVPVILRDGQVLSVGFDARELAAALDRSGVQARHDAKWKAREAAMPVAFRADPVDNGIPTSFDATQQAQDVFAPDLTSLAALPPPPAFPAAPVVPAGRLSAFRGPGNLGSAFGSIFRSTK
jgi:glutaredoxin